MLLDASSQPVRDISLAGKKIIGLPQSDTDASTKGYVDLRRNYITVWASAKGVLNNNH
jgi:hypothetical protein